MMSIVDPSRESKFDIHLSQIKVGQNRFCSGSNDNELCSYSKVNLNPALARSAAVAK
jgi:hypothetical protein